MPRRPLQRSREHYYHLTARANNKEYFPIPVDDVWNILIRRLKELQLEFDLKIVALVLMHNHFHLLSMTPNEDIDRVMYFLMKRVTLDIQKAAGRINKIFGGRYKGSLIENQKYLSNVYKYIYRNPIAAKLTSNAEEYNFSTLYYRLEPKGLPIKLEMIQETSFEEELRWINQKFDDTDVLSIKGGLKKTVFEYKKERSTGRLLRIR